MLKIAPKGFKHLRDVQINRYLIHDGLSRNDWKKKRVTKCKGVSKKYAFDIESEKKFDNKLFIQSKVTSPQHNSYTVILHLLLHEHNTIQSDRDILFSSCTCPSYHSHWKCKHIGGLLYKIADQIPIDTKVKPGKYVQIAEDQDYWSINHVKIPRKILPDGFNPYKSFKNNETVLKWIMSKYALPCIILILCIAGLLNTIGGVCPGHSDNGCHNMTWNIDDLHWECPDMRCDNVTDRNVFQGSWFEGTFYNIS